MLLWFAVDSFILQAVYIPVLQKVNCELATLAQQRPLLLENLKADFNFTCEATKSQRGLMPAKSTSRLVLKLRPGALTSNPGLLPSFNQPTYHHRRKMWPQEGPKDGWRDYHGMMAHDKLPSLS